MDSDLPIHACAIDHMYMWYTLYEYMYVTYVHLLQLML